MLITATSDLADICSRLAAEAYVTVDTEFMRERTYWPVLCLVQIAGQNEAHAIDPLAPGLDLAPLFELMLNPAVLKVFHACRQDLEIFFHLMGRMPAPLFDTQVAAMVCGFGESVGYEALVSRTVGAAVDKSSRFTDWSARPLSQQQLDYALADVVHLRPAYEAIRAMLDKNGRVGWVAEEMAILTDPATYTMDADNAWRRLKPRTAKPRFLAVLQQVAAWRERQAQSRNVPRGRILKDEAVTELAAQKPANAAEMAKLRALPPGYARSEAAGELLAAIARGLDMPKADCPTLPDRIELTPQAQAAVELLRVLLRLVAEREGVAPRLIAGSSDLELLALDDNADVPALRGWRRELFGEPALALKHGQLALALSGGALRLLPLGEAAAPAHAAAS